MKIKCTSGQYQREGQGERDNHSQPKLYHRRADDNYLSPSVKVKLPRRSYRNFFSPENRTVPPPAEFHQTTIGLVEAALVRDRQQEGGGEGRREGGEEKKKEKKQHKVAVVNDPNE